MTNGQVQQLQDLSKCYMPSDAQAFVYYMTVWERLLDKRMNKRAKVIIRRLTHQYRNQIKAMKRNQVTPERSSGAGI